MSQRSNKRLAENLDSMLAEWPLEERTSLEWEQSAAEVEARIRRGAKADETSEMSTYITDEEIFSPPAGQTEKDGHNSGSQRPEPGRVSKAAPVPTKLAEESKMSLTNEQRERDRKSLQDLARMAALTPHPASVRSVPVATPSKPNEAARPLSAGTSDVMLPSTRGPEEDSGLVNLAALTPPPPPSAQPVSSQPFSSQPPMSMRSEQVRESVSQLPVSPRTAPAQAGLFDEDPASVRPQSVPPPMGSPLAGPESVGGQLVATLPSGSVPPMSAHASQAPVAVQAVPSQRAQELVSKADKKKSGAAVYVIGTVIALAAVAAGGVFVVKPRLMKMAAQPPAAVAKTEEKPAVPEMPSTRWQDQIAQNSAPATATADTAAPNDMELTAPDPAKPAPVAKKGAPFIAKKNNKAADELAQAPAPPPPAPATPAPKVESKDGTVATDDALGHAMKTAAGPINSGDMTTPDEKKSAFAPGSVPQRPSQGAVTGALGAVLPNARACLNADDAVSKATVVFGSEGSVKSVSVHGGAQGKPAEACIKGALSHAKVPPFAEETYTANVTVRH